MKLMKMLRVATAALLTLMLCAQGLPSASAASGTYDEVKDACSLTVEFAPHGEALSGSRFEIWRVAERTVDGWVILEKFRDYNVLQGSGELSDKAVTLLPYLRRDKIQPDREVLTNEKGLAVFDDLQAGLYLVSGGSVYLSESRTRYTPMPFLIPVPYPLGSNNWESDVEASVKYDTVEEPDIPNPTIDRHVLKTWNDAGHQNQRPESVVVDLLRDGVLYDTVTLTAANNWRYDWTGLDAKYEWTIAERVTGNYTVIVQKTGITFQIINTWPDDPGPGPGPDNPPPGPDNPPPGPGPDDPPPTIEIPEDPTPLGNPPDVPPEETEVPENPTPLYNPPEETEIPDDPTPLDGAPRLPQTGQLWWPVAPMAVGGLTLSALGLKRRKDGSPFDET